MNLKELSDLLGLSQTTVSRALNGYPEVSEDTRQRVQMAARQHGYRPNARARGLAMGRALAVAHVLPLSKGHEMVNPVFADFIAGAGEVYSGAGYDMLMKIVPDDREEEAYRELAGQSAVDGVIVHGPLADDPRIEMLRSLGLPFVVHGRSSEAKGDYPYVDMDNRRAFERATDLLLDLGHRQIAFLNGLETMDFAMRRRQGFEAALEARGVAAYPELMRDGEMTEAMGYEAADALLDGPNPPTAFLVSSMIMAIGVRRALEDRRLRMGRDVSVVTHDDMLGYLPNGEVAGTPVFTATQSSVRDAGRKAAEMLLAHVANPEAGVPSQLLTAQLTLGGSTGPAPGVQIDPQAPPVSQ